MPAISVIIPAFNEEEFLGNCLLSLKKQDFKDFEIIVVDNNSTDKTGEIAKKFGVILVSEKNQGVAFARNIGVQRNKAKFDFTFSGLFRDPIGLIKNFKKFN
jgi:glycosyltransferase involved in cell wall biosynthesis